MIEDSEDRWKSIDAQLGMIYRSRLEREIVGYTHPKEGELNARAIILTFLLFSMRYIKSIPRQVAISKELKQKIPSFEANIQREIDILITNIETGTGNLNSRLPLVSLDSPNPDPMLFTWGIRRLYLGVGAGTEKFIPRLDLVAFVVFSDHFALLIDMENPDLIDVKSVTDVKRFLSILYKNWPELCGSFLTKSQGEKVLDGSQEELTKPVEIESTITFFPLGSIKASILRADEMISRTHHKIEKIIVKDPSISISDIKLRDKGAIALEYTSGNEKKLRLLFDLSGNSVEDIEGKFMNFDNMRDIIEKQFANEIPREVGNQMLDEMSKKEEMALIKGTKPYVVAMVDVLGFKGILDNYTEKLNELGQIYRNLQFQANQQLLNEGIIVRDGKGVIKADPISHVFFSDTILMWVEIHYDDHDRAIKINRFLNSLQFLMHNALVSEELPLRAGIAYGNCILALDANLFIGEPIAWAHIVESNQEWVGAAYHPSFMKLIDSLSDVETIDANRDAYIVEYPEFPLKKNKDGTILLEPKDRPSFVFSFLGGQRVKDKIEILKKKAIDKNPKELNEILSKYDNTVKFLKYFEGKS